MVITKTYAGLTFVGGGFLAGIMGMQQAARYMAPPPDMNFIQHMDYYAGGYSALGAITAPIIALGFFYFRQRETKRHNKAMEPKDD